MSLEGSWCGAAATVKRLRARGVVGSPIEDRISEAPGFARG
jgi:hypothetical protein